MKACKIFLLKAARFEQHHRQGVTEGEHDGSAGSRREIERTCLLFHVHVEQHVAVAREGGSHVAAKGNYLYLETRDRRQDTDKFVGLAAEAKRKNDIAVRNHAEVPVKGIH